MENLINWFEIPAVDFKRAVKFYAKILDAKIEETDMMDMKMGFLPSDGTNVSGAIVKSESNQPSESGPLLYLNGGNDLQIIANRIENAGGSVVVNKTRISPEYGYFAIFIDTEGNRIALHSMN
ncbi:MAG: VOC family protein [Flammeovirgaceae bacterium]|nr:VOC family protein [Flammeovirgaceae bacterium]